MACKKIVPNCTIRRNAKEYAREVIEDVFGQKIDNEALEIVADKIVRAMPRYYGI